MRQAAETHIMTHPEIYLVRHGETEWNRALRYQGQWESDLTDQGQNQARAVGRRLAQDLPTFDSFTFQCSPLGRCRQTAGLICEMADIDPATIIFDDRLMEIHCGRWQGFTRDEVAEQFPEDLVERRRDPWNFEIPGGGESRPMLQARARDWLANLGTNQPILTVSHGMIGRIIRGLYCDLSPDDMEALETRQGVIWHLKDGKETLLEGLA